MPNDARQVFLTILRRTHTLFGSSSAAPNEARFSSSLVLPALMVCLFSVAAVTEAREWTSRDGKYTVNADLLRLEGSQVVLRRENGTVIRVPLDRLSLTDVKYVQEALAAAGRASESPDHIAPYAWSKGQTFDCKTKMIVRAGIHEHTTNGSVHYYVSSVEELPSDELIQDAEGSGTGFVIAEDGYLLTCHHVIEGATRIEVILDGTYYEGTVIGSDPRRDLAIVKIDDTNLPALPLADRNGVEIGMELRAIGYPLSPVIGESVKVTRGSLAGIAEHDGQSYYQIDATINPGNSGGPVVNRRGEVVGVASMKIGGRGISNVDLAIPGTDAQAILSKFNVGFSAGAGGPALNGTDLVRRVRRSVALLKVNSKRRVEGGAKRFTLRALTRSREEDHTVGGYSSPLSMLRGTGIVAESATLVVDEFGTVLDKEGDPSSPVGFDFTGPFGIEAFPNPCPDSWSAANDGVLAIARFEQQGIGTAPWSAGAPMYTYEDPKIKDVVLIPVREKSEYEIVRADPLEVVLSKRYELTISPNEESFHMTIKGSGTISIDRMAGFPRSWEFKGTVALGGQGGDRELAVEMKGENVVKERAWAPSAGNTPPSETASQRAERRHGDHLAKLMERLQAPGASRQNIISLLLQLSDTEPAEECREEMAVLIEQHLDAPLGATRDAAIKALATWGTEKNIPGLATMFEDRNELIAVRAIGAVSKIGGPKAAQAIVDGVKTGADFTRAEKHLQGMGPMVEPYVIGLLSHEDVEVRERACGLLGEIGGRKSVEALRRLESTDPDPSCQAGVRRGLGKLRERGFDDTF